LQIRALQDSHTAHCSLAVHTVAAVAAKTANKPLIKEKPAKPSVESRNRVALFGSIGAFGVSAVTTVSRGLELYPLRGFGLALRKLLSTVLETVVLARRKGTFVFPKRSARLAGESVGRLPPKHVC
jgi:hypothetical protein